jgi:hypothetical protein
VGGEEGGGKRFEVFVMFKLGVLLGVVIELFSVRFVLPANDLFED